jgi:hypothetical protein
VILKPAKKETAEKLKRKEKMILMKFRGIEKKSRGVRI